MPTDAKKAQVTFTMESGDIIIAELYYDMAPNTVLSFIDLVQQGYYDGLTFHRIIEGFMIQGGCPQGTGTGGPGFSIKGEFADNGFTQNTVSHTAGVLSMARSRSMDSAGSQFFICDATASHLNGSYAAFGKVIEGLEFVHAIAKTATNSSDAPITPVVMKTVTVDTFGVDYPKPDRIQ